MLSGRWGKTGISLLNGWDLRQHRYGFIGLEDWSMYPVLRPGSLVLIDESQAAHRSGWMDQRDGPADLFPGTPGRLPVWLVYAV